MDLRNRAKARASMLGYEHPTAAIAAAYGVASDDNRVRALWQVIATGRPAYDKVVELCTVFRFALADAGDVSASGAKAVLEVMLREGGDPAAIARREGLEQVHDEGVDARRASPAQMNEFTKAFQVYVSRKYGKRFREFIGGRIEVRDARQVKNFFEVKTIAHLRGESPFEVTFLVSDRSGKDKFFNLFIEGVNMLLTERTEIGAMLDKRRGDINGLIADLKSAS